MQDVQARGSAASPAAPPTTWLDAWWGTAPCGPEQRSATCQMATPHSIAWHYGQRPWAIELRQELPPEDGEEPFRLHPNAAQALRLCGSWVPTPTAYTIFTDASARSGPYRSAWALCVLAETAGDEVAFQGWSGAHAALSLGKMLTDEVHSTRA